MKIQRTASLWWPEHLNRSVLRERVLLDGWKSAVSLEKMDTSS